MIQLLQHKKEEKKIELLENKRVQGKHLSANIK